MTLRYNLLSVETGLNPYDVRRTCDRAEDKDGPLCYKQMQWIESWMNKPAIKTALGVDPSKHFASCNMEVNQAFTLNGDGMHNSALLLPELVDAGVRLLVYAGNAGEFFRRSPSLLSVLLLVERRTNHHACPAPCFHKCARCCSSRRRSRCHCYTLHARLARYGPRARLCVTGLRIIINVTWCTLHARLPRLFVGGRTTRSLFSEHVFRCTERRRMVAITTEPKSCNTQTTSFLALRCFD